MKDKYKRQMDTISTTNSFEEETVVLLQNIKRKRSFDMNIKKSSKIIIAIALIAVILAGSSVAAVKLTHMKPDQIAEEIGNKKLFEAFSSEDAFLTEQTYTAKNREYKKEYTVNFYGAVRGNDLAELNCWEDLSDFENLEENEFNGEDYYFMFSVEHADGSPWSIFDDGVHPIEFGIFVDGKKPWQVNQHTMGGYIRSGIYEDVCYYIVGFKGFDVENIRIFAYEGLAPDSEKLSFDEETGKISINPTFKGFITEFELPEGMKN